MNKRNVIFGTVGIMVIVPTITYFLISGWEDKSAWLGFLGSYLGAIVTAGVTLYVLAKTLESNNGIQNKTEILEYLNCLAEKTGIYAQYYDLSIREAHDYFIAEKMNKQNDIPYKQFVRTLQKTRAILYEIRIYLFARKDIVVYHTSQYQELLKIADELYEEFDEYGVRVGNAKMVEDLGDEQLIDLGEAFLTTIMEYQKELLEKKTQKEGSKQMKSIKEIHKEVKKSTDKNNKVDIVSKYLELLREEIGDDKVKWMVYEAKCREYVDVNENVIGTAGLATVITFVAVLASLPNSITAENDWTTASLLLFVAVEVLIGYYLYVLIIRRKYCLFASALEQIGKEMVGQRSNRDKNSIN